MDDLEEDTALLLSGGVDSVSLAFWQPPDVAITVDYGQVCAEAEVQAAAEVCKELKVAHETIRVDCSDLGTGTMADRQHQIEDAPTEEWWPYRNQLIITLAAMRVVQTDVSQLVLGAVRDDSDHADGRVEFFGSMDEVVCSQEGSLGIRTPAIEMTSVDLVQESGIPKPLFNWCHSCHRSNFACSRCRGCKKHQAVKSEVFG
jgi:7-cyano-7-deazaguanine synthase